MSRIMRWALVVAIAVLVMSLGAIVYAQTTGEPAPPGSLAGIIVVATMVVQWIGSWAASRSWSIKARKLIPTINFVISTISQMVAAFAAGLGPEPAVTPAVAVMQAGFLATFKNVFVDILVNSFLQTVILTGTHSGIKNTKEAIELGKTKS